MIIRNINYDYLHTIAFSNLQWKLWKLEYSGSVLLPAERHGAPIWTKQRVANKKSSWQLWLNPPSSYPPPSCWFEYIQSKENVHERRVWASGTKLSWADVVFNALFRDTPLDHVFGAQPNIQIAKYANIWLIWLFGYLAAHQKHGQVGFPWKEH